jgi:hypothetical protein
LLLDPKSSVAALKDIKQYAKTQGSQAASDREKDVFLALYFAAIAGALTYHATRITEHSDHDLKESFRTFVTTSWMPQQLVELFNKGACAVAAAQKL